ncbi:ABC transporter permease [Treponema sp.]
MKSRQSKVGYIFSKESLQYFLLFLVVFVALGFLIPKSFLSKFNLQSMAFQIPEFGILALGMMVTIITGGIDLSIIANANLSAILASLAMYAYGGSANNPAITMLTITAVCILSGLVMGLFNGILVSRLGIPAILATLGTMKLFDGVSTVITGGQPLRNYPPIVARLANDTFLGIPISFYVFVVLVVAMLVLMEHSRLGFRIYMIGENPIASRYSGINNERVLLLTYAVAGVMSGIAGLVMMSRFNSIKVGYGNSYQLLTVLVAIMGGVHPNGGRGRIISVVASILTLQCIASGFNILGFTNYVRNVIYGTVLILVMIANVVVPMIRETNALRHERRTMEA